MQHENLTISEFEELDDEQQIRKYVHEHNEDDLVKLLLLIKEKRAVRWEDRAILQMVEKSPLTLWASNKTYKVVLWTGTCEQAYHRDLIGKPFYEIISIYERSQAMEDSIEVIEADEDKLEQLLADFKNYYTKDMEGTRTEFSLVTNSMQLIDDETGEKFYAEIGLPIDLEKALAEHNRRQQEFNEHVAKFENAVEELSKKFATEKNKLLDRIKNEDKLGADQKKVLRQRIKDESNIISSNLKKSKKAFNFEKFLQDNEEAIELSIRKLNGEIGNAINQISPNVDTRKMDAEKVKRDIEHKIELIEKTFDSEIRKRTSAKLNSEDLEAHRNTLIEKLQQKCDEFVLELTEMKESADSAPDITLKGYEAYLSTIDSKMRLVINDITSVREGIK